MSQVLNMTCRTLSKDDIRKNYALFNDHYHVLRHCLELETTRGTRGVFQNKLNTALADGYPLDFVPSPVERPLIYAALYRRRFDIVSLLIKAGADVNASGRGYKPLLRDAVTLHDAVPPEIIRDIAAHTKYIDAEDHYRNTCLDIMYKKYIASGKEYLLNSIKYLLDCNANPKIEQLKRLRTSIAANDWAIDTDINRVDVLIRYVALYKQNKLELTKGGQKTFEYEL